MNPIISCESTNKSKKNFGIVTGTVFGTYEWAESNANFINGCKHDCKYCYSKAMAVRFRRKTPRNWKTEKIRKSSLKKKVNKTKGTIMFPSSHDIHPDQLDYSIEFLGNLLKPGNRVLVVSKPHLECIQTICDEFEEYRDSILFRFTIGSSNTNTLKFWEPGAPSFEERLAALEWAHNKGFQTSISCEPMLDNDIDDVIEETIPYVTDAIWIGKANSLLRRLKVNGWDDYKTIDKANELINWQSDSNIIGLYRRYEDNPKIKWKESIKSVIGLTIPTQKGLDI